MLNYNLLGVGVSILNLLLVEMERRDETDRPFSLKQDFPLHYLVKVGDYEELYNFLELDPVMGVKQMGRVDFQQRTILHYAAMGVNLEGGEKCVEVIIKFLNDLKGEDKEMFLSTGIKRLSNRIRKQHWKSQDGQETIDFINLRDIRGETALHIAAKNENANIVQILLMHSADVLDISNAREQALTLIYTKTPSAITALLNRSVHFDYGVDVDSFNTTERSYCLDFTAVIGDTTDCVKTIEDELTEGFPGKKIKGSSKFSRKKIVYEEAYCLYKIDVDETNADIYQGILTHPLVRFFVDRKIRKLRWIILLAIFLKLLWVCLYMWHIVEVYYNCCELGEITDQLSKNHSISCSQFPFGTDDVKSNVENWTERDRILAYEAVLHCTKENNHWGRYIPVSILTVYVLFTIMFKFAILKTEYLKIQNCILWIFSIFLLSTMYPNGSSFKIQFQFSSFGILLGTLMVLELIHKHIYWAIYIRVLITVIRRFLATLPLFFIVMVGFSISMRMMFPNINPPLTNFRDALMEIFAAIANGKVEWTEGRRYKVGVDDNFQLSGFIMFIVFYVSMILLLFRVLIGFVVADTKKIQEREELNEVSQDLKEIFLFESISTSRVYQWLISFKNLLFLHDLKEQFMLCPKNNSMQLWLKESDIPRYLRKSMRILASKNPSKFRNKMEIATNTTEIELTNFSDNNDVDFNQVETQF